MGRNAGLVAILSAVALAASCSSSSTDDEGAPSTSPDQSVPAPPDITMESAGGAVLPSDPVDSDINHAVESAYPDGGDVELLDVSAPTLVSAHGELVCHVLPVAGRRSGDDHSLVLAINAPAGQDNCTAVNAEAWWVAGPDAAPAHAEQYSDAQAPAMLLTRAALTDDDDVVVRIYSDNPADDGSGQAGPACFSVRDRALVDCPEIPAD